MKRKMILAFLLFALTFGAVTAAAASEQWIHVRIEGSDQEKVMINLPLSLIKAALATIPDDIRTEVHDEMNVAIDGFDMNWSELMEFWEAVKDAPEATFVTVQNADTTVEVKKEGNFVLVNTTEGSENGTYVDVKFPLAVVDALLSGGEGTLNLEAAINALAETGDGHLVSIRDGNDETKVDIWIDDQNISSAHDG